MKKLSYILLSILCISFIIFLLNFKEKSNPESEFDYEFLRIHISANSNSTSDQEEKFKIKNSVVNYLTPYIADCENVEAAEEILSEHINIITNLINTILLDDGFNYAGEVSVERELFPTRYYENCVLESGEYESLKIVLGEGAGDNWWCVVYPPLCFVNKFNADEQNTMYQSRIIEIIKKFFN